ncbi:MAG TPA: hypothetical protein VHV53_10245 [Solirubrobacterales bacterium]|nr:hypothetical protein [Solirubrobacterales bacterium]
MRIQLLYLEGCPSYEEVRGEGGVSRTPTDTWIGAALHRARPAPG